jgi:hypothetical protein
MQTLEANAARYQMARTSFQMGLWVTLLDDWTHQEAIAVLVLVWATGRFLRLAHVRRQPTMKLDRLPQNP